MKLKHKIVLAFFLFSFCCSCFSQKDSSKYLFRIGNDLAVAPILHFSNRGTFNVAPGFFFHISFSNAIVFRVGALYHLKPYTVTEDKVWSPDTKTTFNYFQQYFKIDLLMNRKKKIQSFFSFGVLRGKGIYKEGIEHNYPIDYLNNKNFNWSLGFGYKYALSKNLSVNIEPCFIWFDEMILSEYYEWGPSGPLAWASLVKRTGTNSRVSLFIMLSISYDYISFKKDRK